MTSLTLPPEGVYMPEGSSVVMLTTPDGLSLRAAFWASVAPHPAGTVFVLQGRAEFMEKYSEVFADLLGRGFAVAALDWRGQGGSSRLLSNRRKGHVEDFADYLIDLDCLAEEAQRRGLPQPWSILAHSMGGAITLLALARGPSPFARAVLSAPLVKIHGLKSEAATRVFAQVLSSVGLSSMYIPFGNGRSIMEKPFEGNPLTHDEVRYARSRVWLDACQPLALGDPTVGWVDAALDGLSAFDRDDFGRENRTPIIMLLAGADTVVETRASDALARRMRGASAIIIPGARHELLMERDAVRDDVWRTFDAFVPKAGEGANPKNSEKQADRDAATPEVLEPQPESDAKP